MAKKSSTRKGAAGDQEFGASNYIPYLRHLTEDIIITKKKDLVTIIKVPGFSFETADDAEIDAKKEIRNNVFRGLGGGNFSVYIHTIRRRHSAFPGGDFDNAFCQAVNESWKVRHDPRHVFINEHYVSIIKKHSSIGNIISNISAKMSKSDEVADTEQGLIDAKDELTEARDRVLNSLSGYGASVLGIVETHSGIYCEILEFLGMITNGITSQRYLVPKMTLDKYLQRTRLYFGKKIIECKTPIESKFLSMVSLKNYRPSTYAGMLDSFLRLPFEIIITQSFTFIDKAAAITKMQLQQRRMIQAEDPSVSQIAEINQALDAAMAGRYAFGLHHLTVMCSAMNRKELDDVTSNVNVGFTNIGVTSVRESINMEAAFWAQLPGNQDMAVRAATINTLNVAGYASMHNYPEGKIADNHWGPAVTVFNTTSGTPFFFNFHVRDVGHTMIIGPTGAGKTVLMNFLCAQAQKFRPRIFFFDKDRGAEIFIRAIGGKYINLDPGEYTHFNPFHMKDTHETRSFLSEWLTIMMNQGQKREITPQDTATITQAIDGLYRLPKEQRTLKNVISFLGIESIGSISSKLMQWHGDGERAKLFDNEVDSIDFSSGRVFGFEMADILTDQIGLAAVLDYLFYRIQESLDGTPTMIVLDEAWALIGNDVFGPKIKDWLKVMRKLNAMVIFATQSVEDATKSSISDTLVQQTATQIFLPNLKATDAYKNIFMLSDKEYDIIRTTDPSSRYFLVKQDNGAVIARINLRGMDDIISILSGRADTVRILDEIRAELGDEPEQWMDEFLKRVA